LARGGAFRNVIAAGGSGLTVAGPTSLPPAL